MVEVSVRAEIKQATAYYRELRGTNGMKKAASNAMNVLGRRVRAESVDEIAKRRRVKRSTVRQNVVIAQRAKASELRVVVEGRGRPISLKEYGAKQTSLGVTVNVTGQRKLILGAFGPGFKRGSSTGRAAKKRAISTRPGQASRLGGHVYVRRGAKRLPIRKLWGPSIRTGFAHRTVERHQRKVIAREWPRIMDEKARDQVRKLGAKHGGRP